MRSFRLSLQLSLLVGLALGSACADPDAGSAATDGPADGPGGKADDPVIDADFGLDSRPSNTTCIAPDRPPTGSSVRTARVFPNLQFSQPVGMHQAPGDPSQWYVVEKRGTVRAFANQNGTSSARTFVDIRNVVEDGPDEAGLLGMAFHPDWPEEPTVYLSFNIAQQGRLWSVLTRIRSTDGGDTLDTSTHELVFSTQQPFLNHNGGQIVFGPDGFLYYGLGDGGDAGDPHGNGQNTNTPLGSLLRLDVDHPTADEAYGIPSDNPFRTGGGLPEIYAYGLRNPWRFSFDTQTGDLWLADVGQDAFEEINLIEKGGNYGWRLKEARACFGAASPCDDLPVIDPVAQYDHSQGDRSITGGFVYRGELIPSLRGSYVYGDIVTGRVWALFAGPDGWEPEQLLESGVNMATFAQDTEGEIYIPNYFNGTIHQLLPNGTPPPSDFPQRLSQTGCVDPDDPRTMAPGVIPYDVASPLWSDGADKLRYAAIPDGTRIEVLPDGDFRFPVGTVLVKTFIVGGRRVETRLLMRHPDGGWGGYAYKWNEDQTDAELLPSSETVEVDGHDWRIPSRADCVACHTDAANIALGPELAQLNRAYVYDQTGRTANQVDTWAHIGLFSNLAEGSFDTQEMPRLFGLDAESASLEDRARSYLHSNCSSCHRPGGPGRSNADMRFGVPLAQQNLCNETPEAGALGLTNPSLIKPGDPSDSTVVHRMQSLDAARMPALGSTVVDEAAIDLFSEWIDGMNTACQ